MELRVPFTSFPKVYQFQTAHDHIFGKEIWRILPQLARWLPSPPLSTNAPFMDSKLNRQMRFFFATVNQKFSGSSQLPTTAEHCFIVSNALKDLITARLAEVDGSWEEPRNI